MFIVATTDSLSDADSDDILAIREDEEDVISFLEEYGDTPDYWVDMDDIHIFEFSMYEQYTVEVTKSYRLK